MPIRFLLEFTAPFTVGDTVYLAYPPNQKAVTGSVQEIRPLEATVCAINVGFGQPDELTIKQPVDSYEVAVKQITYTLAPAAPHQFAAFTVNCPANETTPILLATEQEFNQQEAVSNQ